MHLEEHKARRLIPAMFKMFVLIQIAQTFSRESSGGIAPGPANKNVGD